MEEAIGISAEHTLTLFKESILSSLVLHPTLFNELYPFLSPDDLLRCISVCHSFKEIFLSDPIWRLQCQRLSYFNPGTKSRMVLYRSVYKSHQCVECYRSGVVILNLRCPGGKSLKPALCAHCFQQIAGLNWAERLKICLKRIANDKMGVWNDFRVHILSAVPEKKYIKSRKRPNPNEVDYDGAFHNDYLVKALGRKNT